MTDPTIVAVFDRLVENEPLSREEYEPKYASLPLAPMLDLYIAHLRKSRQDSWQAAHRPYFRASTFARCPRAVVLERANVPEAREFDEKTLRTFEWGNLIEAMVQDWLEECGILRDTQVPLIDEELGFSTTLDFVVGGHIAEVQPSMLDPKDPRTQFLIGLRDAIAIANGATTMPVVAIQCKSQHSYAMPKIHKSGGKREHMMQAAGEQLLIRRVGGKMEWVPAWSQLLYVGKDSIGFLEYDITEEWVQAAYDRVRRLQEVWESRTWPDCSCGKKDAEWQIKYCNYGDTKTCCSDDLREAYEEARASEG